MYDLIAMKIFKSIQYLDEKLACLIFIVCLLLDMEQIKKLDSVYVLHNLILLVGHLVVKVVVYPYDIFVVE